jgi:hypothetical protein
VLSRIFWSLCRLQYLRAASSLPVIPRNVMFRSIQQLCMNLIRDSKHALVFRKNVYTLYMQKRRKAMTKKKSNDKGKKKSSQLVIRVDKAERDAFVGLCSKLDTSAAREIRRFMRERVASENDKPEEAVEETTSAVSFDLVIEEKGDDIGKTPTNDSVLESPVKEVVKAKRKRK